MGLNPDGSWDGNGTPPIGGGSKPYVDPTGQIALGFDGQWHYLTYDAQGQEHLSNAVAPPPASVSGAKGLTFDEQMALATAPRSSSSTSQSIADPQTIALQRAQLQETIDNNKATIERNARLDAQAAAQQSWLTQKDMLAAANDDKRTQATVAAQMATIQNQRDIYNFNVQQAQQRAQEAQQSIALDVAKTNAAGQERTGEFNATQGLATQQANNAAAAQKQRDIADANDKIGVLGQDTGNRGRFASFVAANRGFGQAGTAIGQGTSLIDNASAQALENSLVNKENILARPDNPYNFTPLNFNALTVPTIQGPLSNPAGQTATPPGYSNVPQAEFDRMAAVAAQSQGVNAVPNPAASAQNTVTSGVQAASGAPQPMASTQTPSGYVNPYDDPNVGKGTRQTITGNGDLYDYTSTGYQKIGSGYGSGYVPKMEHGGTVQGAYMSGDSSDGAENPEINIPLGNRGAMVISLKGMPPAKIKALKAKMQKFATGGLFEQLGDSPLSQQFLTDASQQFRAGTPWAGQPGALPSPVYQSSPGFNPDLGNLLNSGRALEQGIPASTSAWLANQYSPNTLSAYRAFGASQLSRTQ